MSINYGGKKITFGLSFNKKIKPLQDKVLDYIYTTTFKVLFIIVSFLRLNSFNFSDTFKLPTLNHLLW